MLRSTFRWLFLSLFTFSVAWGAGLYRLRFHTPSYGAGELAFWLLGLPAACVAGCLALVWGWRRHLSARKEKQEAQASQQQAEARQAALAQARAGERRFDSLLLVQGELLLPAPAYERDFAGALAQALPSQELAEVDYEGLPYKLALRRHRALVLPETLACLHGRSLRVAAQWETLLLRLLEPEGSVTRLGRQAAAWQARHPAVDALTPFWDREQRSKPPTLLIRLLVDSSLMEDAARLVAYLESRLPGLGWPGALETRFDIRAADGAQALVLIDALIEATQQFPDQGLVLLAAASQFDEASLRQALRQHQLGDPVQWQYQTRCIPSEGGCALVFLPAPLAAACGITASARVRRPVDGGLSPGVSQSELTLLEQARLRAAPDFDSRAPAITRIWLDGDLPEAALRRAALVLNQRQLPAALEAFQALPAGEAGAPPDEPVPEPEICPAGQVFGPLGAVNALGLLAVAARPGAGCELVMAGVAGARVAVALIPPEG